MGDQPVYVRKPLRGKGLLEDCDRDHQDCDQLINVKRYGMSFAVEERHYKLIKITQRQGDREGDLGNMTARLIEILIASSEKLAVLSYRWARPEDGPYKTTSSNIAENYTSIPLYKLEQQIGQVFTVTLILGFGQIWIDALFIGQGHEGDKVFEIRKMDHICGRPAPTTKCKGLGENSEDREEEEYSSC